MGSGSFSLDLGGINILKKKVLFLSHGFADFSPWVMCSIVLGLSFICHGRGQDRTKLLTTQAREQRRKRLGSHRSLQNTSEWSKHLEVISQSLNSFTLGPNPSLPATPQVFRATLYPALCLLICLFFYLLEGVHTWYGMYVEFRGLIKRKFTPLYTLHHTGPGNWIRIVKLGSKHHYPLSHLMSPWPHLHLLMDIHIAFIFWDLRLMLLQTGIREHPSPCF